MCFSATASFSAGLILSGIGIAAIKQTQSRSQVLFACIPLLFSTQQFAEGFLWLAMTKPAFAGFQVPGTYVFLFFAQVLWPIWVPYSILQLKKKSEQTKAQKILVGIGAVTSLYLIFCLISFHVEAKISNHHIVYEQDYPAALHPYSGILYIIATIIPSFLSGIRQMWMLGATILLSYLIATIFYNDYSISVWCFFASIVSMSIFAILYYVKKEKNVLIASS